MYIIYLNLGENLASKVLRKSKLCVKTSIQTLQPLSNLCLLDLHKIQSLRHRNIQTQSNLSKNRLRVFLVQESLTQKSSLLQRQMPLTQDTVVYSNKIFKIKSSLSDFISKYGEDPKIIIFNVKRYKKNDNISITYLILYLIDHRISGKIT